MGFVLDNAFYSVPRLRHVLVDAGIRTIGAAAWLSCQQLEIVKLPPSVVCIKEGAFRVVMH